MMSPTKSCSIALCRLCASKSSNVPTLATGRSAQVRWIRSAASIKPSTPRLNGSHEDQFRPISTVKRRNLGSSTPVNEFNNRNARYTGSSKGIESLRNQHQQKDDVQFETSTRRNTQLAATLAESDSSDLVTEVHVAPDPHGILPSTHPALAILGNSSLVVQRQLELMNVFLGFEQANRYIIMDGNGQTLGYIAERDHGLGSAMARQIFRTHRSFTTHIFDREEREVLRIHRPFAYINSRIRIYDPIPEGGHQTLAASTALQGLSASSAQGSGAQISPLQIEDMRVIGEARQQWAPLRRKYDLFTLQPFDASPDSSNATQVTESTLANEFDMTQFAHINERFLSWDFTLCDEAGKVVGSVNRNFGGFAREIFTDTGVYALRMDSAAEQAQIEDADNPNVPQQIKDVTSMTLDQRAVMLATAVSIDFDYFSRHSGAHMPLPIPMMGGGGAAAEGAGAAGAGGVLAGGAGAVGEAGAVVGAAEAAGGVAGVAGRGVAGAAGRAGVGEGAIAGAGTMAGYEAMQRGVYGDGNQSNAAGTSTAPPAADSASPQAPVTPDGEEIFDPDGQFTQSPEQASESNLWDSHNNDDDPWRGGDTGGSSSGSGSSDGGGDAEGGGGWLDSISDFFES